MAAQEARDQAGQMAGRAQDQAQQMGGKAREMGGQAGKKAQGVFQRLKEVMPKSAVGWVALVAIAGALAIGSAIVLVILSPVLLFFRRDRALFVHCRNCGHGGHGCGHSLGGRVALPLYQG